MCLRANGPTNLIRMILYTQLPIRLLYFLLARVSFDPKEIVRIAESELFIGQEGSHSNSSARWSDYTLCSASEKTLDCTDGCIAKEQTSICPFAQNSDAYISSDPRIRCRLSLQRNPVKIRNGMLHRSSSWRIRTVNLFHR